MPTKQQLYDFCQAYTESRISRIKKNIKDIQDSLTSETKSSAGDKHETGRAMLQLEREKLGHQLAEAEKMKQVLAKIALWGNTTSVGLGSWVKTSKSDYFLAISAGEFKNDGISIFCISAATPMGRLLLGRSRGESVMFGTEEIKILNIE